MQSEKESWARLSIASNSILVVLKIAVGILTGSVSIAAEGMHSGVDLAASVITFFGVRISGRKADRDHNFGHGKFENIAGLAEGILIFVGAGIIIYEALPKLFTGEGPETLGWGLGVMALSTLINFLVSRKLFQISKKTGSPALAADAWHLRTDVYTSLGVFGGLVLIKITGMAIFDPIIALCVAIIILKAAYGITMDGIAHMVDVSLPEAELVTIQGALARQGEHYLEFHDLRARKSGSQRFIDLHLVVPREHPIHRVHDLCNALETEIEKDLPHSHVLIHPEPCDAGCKTCAIARRGGREGCA